MDKPYYDHDFIYQGLKSEGNKHWSYEEPHFDHRMNVAMALRFLKIKKGKLLDIGCGTGEDAIAFSRMGFEVTAVDYSPTAIEMAQEHNQKDEVHFQVGNALDLNTLSSRSFDVILSGSTLHSFSDNHDRSSFYKEITRLIKPDGHIFISTLCELPSQEDMEKHQIDPQTGVSALSKFRVFKTLEMLEAEFRKHNLKLINKILYQVFHLNGASNKEGFFYLQV